MQCFNVLCTGPWHGSVFLRGVLGGQADMVKCLDYYYFSVFEHGADKSTSSYEGFISGEWRVTVDHHSAQYIIEDQLVILCKTYKWMEM